MDNKKHTSKLEQKISLHQTEIYPLLLTESVKFSYTCRRPGADLFLQHSPRVLDGAQISVLAWLIHLPHVLLENPTEPKSLLMILGFPEEFGNSPHSIIPPAPCLTTGLVFSG